MRQFHRPTQNFLLGKNQPDLAFADYKLAVLTAQLSLLAIGICLLYLFIDLQNGIFDSWYLQSGGALLSFLSFILNRKGYYYWAKVLLVIAGDIIVFSFAILEPIEIGVGFLFILCYIVTIAGFGFEHRRTSWVLIAFTTLLIITSIVFDLHIVPRRVYPPEYISFNLVTNLIVTCITCVLVVYFLVTLNYYSEGSLRKKEMDLNQKNEELVKVNTELDRFVYSTSHDLRSPISSLRGLINLTKYTNDTVEIKSYLSMMEGRLTRLDKFIKDISDYSRNSRLPLNIGEVNIKTLINDALENLQFYPGAEKVSVELSIQEDLTIKSDFIRMQILLGNLLSNAFKYVDPGKSNSFIKVTVKANTENIVISIGDNGIGIHSDYAEKIFDMFFQGYEKSDGSGLGLYIVKETLEKIKGTISVKSVLGEGSIFTVVIPKSLPDT
ncbi:MAG TPA: HAMP domain-containing sensor histidine kinase [Chryseolinea sp.]|nr:HAMP domain-containing sensor histidine kinase [Chryseolinea sp.]